MPGIEDRLAKIKAIQAEAEAKKATEKEVKDKESAEKRAGLEQEKAQVEGELAQTAEELQKNESGLAEINAMDLSDFDAESRAAIESEIVGIKEEMDNLSGKVAELTKRKQEVDEALKGATGETEKTSDNGVTELKADVVAVEKTENTEQDTIAIEIQRPLNPEEQQDLDYFSKKLEQIQLTPEKLALIHDYNEAGHNELKFKTPKTGAERRDLRDLFKALNDLKDSISRTSLREVVKLRTKIRHDAALSKEKRADYERLDNGFGLETQYKRELRKISDEIDKILES